MLVMVHPTERLKTLREHARLSQKDMAQAMGYKGQSSYYRLENRVMVSKTYFSLDIVKRIDEALAGRGDPPVPHDEIAELLKEEDRATFLRMVGADKNETAVAAPKPQAAPISEGRAIKAETNYVAVFASDDGMADIIQAGDRIIVDIEAPIEDGNYVAAKLIEGNAIIIRQYSEHGDDASLHPLNDEFPMVELGLRDRIIGRAVCKIVRF